MRGNKVLLVLHPAELLSFELTRLLDLSTFFLEASMSLLIRIIQVLHVLLALACGMVVDLKRSLGAHEVRISLRMVA